MITLMHFLRLNNDKKASEIPWRTKFLWKRGLFMKCTSQARHSVVGRNRNIPILSKEIVEVNFVSLFVRIVSQFRFYKMDRPRKFPWILKSPIATSIVIG